VEPLSGEGFFLVMPRCGSVFMNIFLHELSTKYKSDNIILVCDDATLHKSKMLNVQKNIQLFYLPPATPEMNPIEKIWSWIRRHCFKNEIFSTLDKVVYRLCDTIRTLNSSIVKSITSRD
jgi:putative transposase